MKSKAIMAPITLIKIVNRLVRSEARPITNRVKSAIRISKNTQEKVKNTPIKANAAPMTTTQAASVARSEILRADVGSCLFLVLDIVVYLSCVSILPY